jgi:hypothetical protein
MPNDDLVVAWEQHFPLDLVARDVAAPTDIVTNGPEPVKHPAC